MADVEPGTGKRAGEGRLSWPVFLLMLAAVISSSLSALSLYQLVALRAEVEGLKSKIHHGREEGQEAKHGGQTDSINSRRSSQEPTHQPGYGGYVRRRRSAPGIETLVSQPCLQLLANTSRKPFYKGLLQGQHLCNGSHGDPVEGKRGGKRGSECDPVPLCPEYEPNIPFQYLLHRRYCEAGGRGPLGAADPTIHGQRVPVRRGYLPGCYQTGLKCVRSVWTCKGAFVTRNSLGDLKYRKQPSCDS